jgi:hypothetical protein
LKWLLGGWYDDRGEFFGGWYEYKTVVTGKELMEHRDLINELFTTELSPTEKAFLEDALLYYVFEHRELGEIFSVIAFGRFHTSVFINGVEVERENIFTEVLLPFLPEDIAEDVAWITM